MTIEVNDAALGAYQPAAGQPRHVFTVAATARTKASPPPPPQILGRRGGVTISAPAPLASLLVRVPDGVDLIVKSRDGDVTVVDITGNASIEAAHGDVTAMLPGYAQAAVGQGNLSVTMGSTTWPGTLHFSSGRGDVTIYIGAKASFHAHLHTQDGVLFTDFGLRGTSVGRAETIDGDINGGGGHGIDVNASSGDIRLLRLQPQA